MEQVHTQLGKALSLLKTEKHKGYTKRRCLQQGGGQHKCNNFPYHPAARKELATGP